MLHRLLTLLRRPALRFGLRRDPRSRLRDQRFVSFLDQHNRRSVDSDFHDTVLRGRKLMKNVLKLAVIGGGAWIVLESAKALSVF